MGKEKKDKKDKKRKASDSDDSNGHRSKQKHKEKKHKKDKDKNKDAAEEKRLVKEAKKFLKQRLKEDGAQPSSEPPLDNSLPPPEFEVTPISEEEYFAKNPEFSAWLRDIQRVQFNDLEADDARSRFKEFVALWNGRKLPARIYSGIDGGSLRRTQHSWGRLGASAGASGSGSGNIVRGMAAALEEEREAATAAAAGRAVERRKWKAEQTELLDEMLPKAGPGREARLDAAKARREDARAREASPDVVHLPGGGDPMGAGGDDSFAAARARQAAQAARRGRFGAAKAADMQQKVADFSQKEDATMAQFKALLDRGPIQIQKR